MCGVRVRFPGLLCARGCSRVRDGQPRPCPEERACCPASSQLLEGTPALVNHYGNAGVQCRARRSACSVNAHFIGGGDRNSWTRESVSLDMCTDHTNVLLECRPNNNSTVSSEISLFFLLANSGPELLQQKLASFRKDLFEATQQKTCRFLAGESQRLPGTHGPGQTGKRLHPVKRHTHHEMSWSRDCWGTCSLNAYCWEVSTSDV